MKRILLTIGCLLLASCACPRQEMLGMHCVKADVVNGNPLLNGCPICTEWAPDADAGFKLKPYAPLGCSNAISLSDAQKYLVESGAEMLNNSFGSCFRAEMTVSK